MSEKQERWFTIEYAASQAAGVASYDLALEEARARLADDFSHGGNVVYILRAVAIVRPPAVQAPVVERLPGAPRKRRATAGGPPAMAAIAQGVASGDDETETAQRGVIVEARNPGDEAVDYTPEKWTTEPLDTIAEEIITGHPDDDNLYEIDNRPRTSFRNVEIGVVEDSPAPKKRGRKKKEAGSEAEGVARAGGLASGSGVGMVPGEGGPIPLVCPLCASGSAPAKGMHTDAKGKRHRCPDARKEKA